MKIRIISIGKVKQKFIKDGEAEYLKRLAPSYHLEFTEIDCDKYSALPEAEMMKKEAEELFSKVKPDSFLVILDVAGKALSSGEFATLFRERQSSGGAGELVFAIGGVCGWDKSVFRKAHLTLSLSHMTFTHQMTRLFLVEQLYRAVTILEGQPYHK